MRRILLVCTGNTCRSSMAKVLTEDMVKKSGQADKVEIFSAGTMAVPGHGANPKAIKAMDQIGLDLSDHQSTPISNALIEQADLIIAMTENHKQQILFMAPDYQGQIKVLDVPDPFGGSDEEYRRCRDEIHRQLSEIFEDKLF